MKFKLEYRCDPEEADLVAWTVMHTLDQLGFKYEEPVRTNQTDVSGGNILDSTLVTVEVPLHIKDLVSKATRLEVLDELVKEAQEMGFYDNPPKV